jgi:hypothetical protein
METLTLIQIRRAQQRGERFAAYGQVLSPVRAIEDDLYTVSFLNDKSEVIGVLTGIDRTNVTIERI